MYELRKTLLVERLRPTDYSRRALASRREVLNVYRRVALWTDTGELASDADSARGRAATEGQRVPSRQPRPVRRLSGSCRRCSMNGYFWAIACFLTLPANAPFSTACETLDEHYGPLWSLRT